MEDEVGDRVVVPGRVRVRLGTARLPTRGWDAYRGVGRDEDDPGTDQVPRPRLRDLPRRAELLRAHHLVARVGSVARRDRNLRAPGYRQGEVARHRVTGGTLIGPPRRTGLATHRSSRVGHGTEIRTASATKGTLQPPALISAGGFFNRTG